jgi:Cd2+/Zn2+-exporting ATPase
MRKTYLLEGLCCPNCAAKIEKHVSALQGVHQALIDFPTQILSIEAQSPDLWGDIMTRTSRIIKELEPSVEIRDLVPHGDTVAGPKNKAVEIKPWLHRGILGLGMALFVVGMIGDFAPNLTFGIFLASYVLVGGEVLLRALRNILKGEIFDENFLMSIATIGAFAIGEYPEGVAVMIFYQIGEAFQSLAVNRSRKSIAALMDIRPDYANLKTLAGIQRVSPETVRIGDHIVVKPGEKIPLDGVVAEGVSTLDTSALTGESLPRDVEPGSPALSGSINKNGLLTIEVTKVFGESTVSKILDLVQNAGSKKSPTENFITKFARYYTPAVVFSALALALLPPLFIPQASFTQWLHRALVFLVVSCPCALVISIPLSFFGGIGGASRKGILIKGSNYLETLTQVNTVVFDKTGTLTKGVFKVTKIVSERFSPEGLLFYAAHAESNSTHPIGLSIRNAYTGEIEAEKIRDYEEIAGKGISVRIGEDAVLAGNCKLLEAAHIPFPAVQDPGTLVYLAVNHEFAGYLVISDELKPDSLRAVQDLRAAGVRQIAMLTGDSKVVGEAIAQEIGLDTVYAELLPHQKVERLEALEQETASSGKLVFVGDGINDAPVLARSDVGIAMGGLGSDAAIEAADIVLMTDEPAKIPEAIRIARKTRTIVWQNIIFALGVKGVVLVLGALGIATMWEAVFGDVGVMVIAILNAMRAMKT